MGVRCPNCGAEVRDGAHFCEECGFKIEVQPKPAAIVTPRPVAAAGSQQPQAPKPESTQPVSANQPQTPRMETTQPTGVQKPQAPRPVTQQEGARQAQASRPQQPQTPRPQPAPAPKSTKEAREPAPVAPKKKKKNKIILFAIIGFVVLALVAGLVFFFTWKFTVTFDSAGGSPVAEQKIGRGNPAKRPDDPTREGFDFMGWYLDDKEYNFNQPVKSSFTLLAHWNESKFVTFIVDGVEIAREHVVNGRVTFPQAPQKDGYAFVCWQDESSMEGTEDRIFSENVTLTARYKVFIPITSIGFEKPSYVMERDSTLKPKLIIKPNDWVETLSFTTTNAAVATVAPDGTITANGGGTTVITVNTESGKSASCEITVKVSCKTLKFKQAELILKKGDSFKPELEIDPLDMTETLTYSSSDKSVATIDEEGTITAVAYGTTTITATAGKVKATLKVTVANPATNIKVTTPITVVVGESPVAITVTLTPKDSTSTLSYVSNDTSIAKVDADGKVTGIKGGKTTITVSTDNGLTAKVDVNVNQYTLVVETEQTGPANEGYLYYNPSNQPMITVKRATLTVVTGETSETHEVLDKLIASGTDSVLKWDNGRLYVASDGYSKVTEKEITFQCKMSDGRTVSAKKIKVTVEPVLDIIKVEGGTYTGGTINLPASEEPVEFTVRINQKVSAKYENIERVSVAHPSGYTDIVLRKAPGSGAGKLTLSTAGGQKMVVTIN